MSYIGNTSTTQAFTPAVDYFSGNGSTTAFTLSKPVASVAQVEAVIDNVVQNPSSAYTVSSNTITFTSAPLSGTNNIYVRYTSPITQVIAPGQGTVTATSMASSTGTGAGVFQTSPTITTPTIDTITSAASTALTLKSAGTTAVTIDTAQNVGIGTASPDAKLSLKSPSVSGTQTILTGVAATSSTDLFALTVNQTTDVTTIGTPSGYAAPFAFQTNGTERMRIDSSGNLLVNTTSATGASKFVVAADTTSVNPMTVSNTRSTAATDYSILFYRNGSIVGSVQTTLSATSFVTSSDYRLKEDIQPMTGALAKVAQLNPVTYKWKLDGTEAQGFIAHELQAVIPDCVTGTKDELDADGNPKYQGIDTSFLVATLTAAIQELKAINDTQAETINTLTARIEALEAK